MISYLKIFIFFIAFTKSIFGSALSAPRKGLDVTLASRGVPAYLLPSNLTIAQHEVGFLLKDLRLGRKFAGIWPARIGITHFFAQDHISALLAYAFPYDAEGTLTPNTRCSARISVLSPTEIGTLIRVLDAHEPESALLDMELLIAQGKLKLALSNALGVTNPSELEDMLERHRIQEWQAQMVGFLKEKFGQIDPSDMEEDEAAFSQAKAEGRLYRWAVEEQFKIESQGLLLEDWDSSCHDVYNSGELSRSERTKRSRLQKMAFADLLAEAFGDAHYADKRKLVQKILAIYAGLRAKTSDDLYALYSPWIADTTSLTHMPSFSSEEKASLLSGLERSEAPLAFWRGLSAEQRNALVYQFVNNSSRFATLPRQGASTVTIDGREKSFSDCFESSLLAFLATTLAHADPRSGTLSIELSSTEPIVDTASAAAAALVAPRTARVAPYFRAYHNCELLNTQEARNAFSQMLSGIEHIEYEKLGYEVTPSFRNFARLIRHLFGEDRTPETTTIKDELAAIGAILSTHSRSSVTISLDADEPALNADLSQNMWGDMQLSRDGLPVLILSMQPGHASWQRTVARGTTSPLDSLASQILDWNDPTFLQSEGFLRIVPFLSGDNILRTCDVALTLPSPPLLAMIPPNQAHLASGLLAKLFAACTRERFSCMAFSKAMEILHFVDELFDRHIGDQIFAPVKDFYLSADCTPEIFTRLLRFRHLLDLAPRDSSIYNYLSQTRPDLAPMAALHISHYCCGFRQPMCPFLLNAMGRPEFRLKTMMLRGTTTSIEELSPEQRLAMSSLNMSYVSFSADSSLAAVMPIRAQQLSISSVESVDAAELAALVSRFRFEELELIGAFSNEAHFMEAARAIDPLCDNLSKVFQFAQIGSKTVSPELIERVRSERARGGAAAHEED